MFSNRLLLNLTDPWETALSASWPQRRLLFSRKSHSQDWSLNNKTHVQMLVFLFIPSTREVLKWASYNIVTGRKSIPKKIPTERSHSQCSCEKMKFTEKLCKRIPGRRKSSFSSLSPRVSLQLWADGQFFSDRRGNWPCSCDVGSLGVNQADVEADLIHVPRRGWWSRVQGGRGRWGGGGREGGVRAQLCLGVQHCGGGGRGEGGGWWRAGRGRRREHNGGWGLAEVGGGRPGGHLSCTLQNRQFPFELKTIMSVNSEWNIFMAALCLKIRFIS